MASMIDYASMALWQACVPQTLERTPEPTQVTDDLEHVLAYDQVLETKLAISYALAVETIYRVLPEFGGGRALDVACGPGHLAISMYHCLKLAELTGVDLSQPMIDVANKNCELPQVRFQKGDATDLGFSANCFDLTTLMDAAHHFDTVEQVRSVIAELERVTTADGTIVVMDLVRLKSRSLTEKYVQKVGQAYGPELSSFYSDFYHSMYASWTAAELKSALPENSNYQWWSLVPRGLPTMQFLIGKKSDRLFERAPYSGSLLQVSPSERTELRAARAALRLAKAAKI